MIIGKYQKHRILVILRGFCFQSVHQLLSSLAFSSNHCNKWRLLWGSAFTLGTEAYNSGFNLWKEDAEPISSSTSDFILRTRICLVLHLYNHLALEQLLEPWCCLVTWVDVRRTSFKGGGVAAPKCLDAHALLLYQTLKRTHWKTQHVKLTMQKKNNARKEKKCLLPTLSSLQASQMVLTKQHPSHWHFMYTHTFQWLTLPFYYWLC